MSFKKYSSIFNCFHDNENKALNELVLRNCKDFSTIKFQVTEKLHGANFSIIAENGEIKFAQRTGIIKDSQKFHDFRKMVIKPEYSFLFKELLALSKERGKVQLYTEFFGGNIQKGVWYGEKKKFLWYAVRVNDVFISTNEADIMLEKIKEFKVPVIGFETFDVKNETINEFVERINCKFTSTLTPKDYEKQNICEGIVIIPYDIVPMFGNNYFAIKKKNKEFADRKSEQRRIFVQKDIPENVQEIIDIFCTYINEVRTNDLMSKMGELESIKDVSKYAKAYFSDAMNDFLIEYEDKFNLLRKAFQKDVTKAVSRVIFKELKRYLETK